MTDSHLTFEIMRRAPKILFRSAGSIFLLATLLAQTPVPPKPPSDEPAVEQPQGKEFVFRATVNEVLLYATVLDERGRQVMGLDRASFNVFEDNLPQAITSFHNDDVPVSVGIVIDNSASMQKKRQAVNQAALNFVRASNKNDEVFVVNFNWDAYIDQDFTANVSLLKQALENIDARGGTYLYDALIASADHVAKGGRREKKVLLLVTDGLDETSKHTLEDASDFLQKDGGPILYAIGLFDEESGHDRRIGQRALNRLTAATGGKAFFPKSLEEVDAITKQVAHDIRTQYTIGYKPAKPTEQGGYRSIRVEAKAPGKGRLEVRTKSGYFAGQKKTSG